MARRTDGNGATRMRAAFATADGRSVDLHAWVEGGGSLRDENNAHDVADLLADGTAVVRAAPTGKRLLFEVWLDVSDTRRDETAYSCDYRRYDGCPLNVIDAGMDVYRSIKRAVRMARAARNEGKAKKEVAE